MAVDYIVSPGGPLQGCIEIAGDKSISHRAVMLAALAEGRSVITGLLEGEDVLGTIAAFRALGVSMEGPLDGRLVVDGVGFDGLQVPVGPLDLGNSGTSMRLLTGVLSAQAFDTRLIGDSSLMTRPMERVATPLRLMGAHIETGSNGRPPLTIRGGASLKGITYTLPVASAQVKSAVLLAGLYAQGETTVIEPAPSRDHTERMLVGFGYPVRQKGAAITVQGHAGRLVGAQVAVPADLSSAAFFLVAASIVPGSHLELMHVGINPTRAGVLTILQAMGARIQVVHERIANGELVADLIVDAASLRGITIPAELVPLAIDEFPIIFVAAACATGTTVLRGAAELRVKESDRLAGMARGLRALGVSVEEFADGLSITGGPITAGTVNSEGDHRIAMAFAVAALRSSGSVVIQDCHNVATSFPQFTQRASEVGFDLRVVPT